MLHVNITLLQDAHAVASDQHVLRRIHIDLDHDRTIDLTFHTRRGVLSADSAGLVEHMGRHSAQVGADEHLQIRRLVVTDQPDDREAIPGAVLHRAPRPLRLIAGSVLLLGLADNLQLNLAVG